MSGLNADASEWHPVAGNVGLVDSATSSLMDSYSFTTGEGGQMYATDNASGVVYGYNPATGIMYLLGDDEGAIDENDEANLAEVENAIDEALFDEVFAPAQLTQDEKNRSLFDLEAIHQGRLKLDDEGNLIDFDGEIADDDAVFDMTRFEHDGNAFFHDGYGVFGSLSVGADTADDGIAEPPRSASTAASTPYSHDGYGVFGSVVQGGTSVAVSGSNPTSKPVAPARLNAGASEFVPSAAHPVAGATATSGGSYASWSVGSTKPTLSSGTPQSSWSYRSAAPQAPAVDVLLPVASAPATTATVSNSSTSYAGWTLPKKS